MRASTARRGEGSRKVAASHHLTYHRGVSALHSCEVCRAKVSELRRGRCWGCYAQWVDSRPVGAGARCVTCTEKRRNVLRSVELFGAWQPMCFNCHGQVGQLDPMPETLAELRTAVSRERRQVDRRIGKADSRVFRYERRVGERRLDRDEFPQVDDEMIMEVSYTALEVDIGFDEEQLTGIHFLPTADEIDDAVSTLGVA